MKQIPHVPELFKVIIEHDNEIAAFFAQPALDMTRGTELIRRRRELSAGAERALKWNTDKGATA